MFDQKVYETQQWLNLTYGDRAQWNDLDEDGLIGWKTIFGLIRGLQCELGITSLSDNFGDGTMNALTAQHPKITATSPTNMCRLAQSALWCHGYSAGFNWGNFDNYTNNAIKAFSVQCGLVNANQSIISVVTPKMLKALMTLDAYTLLPGGSVQVREAQQWLNGTYKLRKLPFLPCDGLFNRSTQQGLMTAIQYELDMTDAQANGNFGAGTKAGLKANGGLSAGATDTTRNWVRLFQSALRMNGYTAPLSGVFDPATVSATSSFQAFAELAGNGAANFATWASLLISTGDDTRPGIASDMSRQLTPAYCNSLYTAGYRTVGRYLSVLGKRYAPRELEYIFAAGLKTFPIMQEANTAPSDFSLEKGRDHGYQALFRLRQLGFKDDTTVFFAVDLDALDDTITSRVIPYFQGVNEKLNSSHSRYKVGVYGTRNVCARVVAAGLASEGFIASMSWGWGGNLGFPLPPAWSYDQIRNHMLTGTDLEIDTNIQSSRARPVGASGVHPTPTTLVPPPNGGPPSVPSFDEDYYWYVVDTTTRAEMRTEHTWIANEFALQSIAKRDYNDLKWEAYAPGAWGDPSLDIAYDLFNSEAKVPPSATRSRLTHWAASTRGYSKHWSAFPPTGGTAVLADVGAWGFDLAQAVQDYRNSSSTAGRSWFAANIGTNGSPGFGREDLVADIDAYIVARAMREDSGRPLDDIVREIEVQTQADKRWRFRKFVEWRFGGNMAAVASAGASVFTQAWSSAGAGFFVDVPPDPAEATQIGLGFADAIRAAAEL